MGCALSTPSRPDQRADPLPPELSAYEAACREDADLRAFDAGLQARTGRAVAAVAASGAVDLRSISFSSLKEVTGCLLDNDAHVVQTILAHKRDVWKDPGLSNLVEDYFRASLATLDFVGELESCLRRARDAQLLLRLAVRHLEDGEPGKAAAELEAFRSSGDPFSPEFFASFDSVYRQQVAMLARMKERKRKIDSKIRSAKTWRRVSCVIFASAFAAVLICSVVASAMAAPPVAAALAAAMSIPVGSMGKWFNSMWKRYEAALEGERGVVSVMDVGSMVVVQDLVSIRAVVDRMQINIDSMVRNVEFGLRDDLAMRIAVGEIKEKMEVFLKSVEELSVQAQSCSRDIRRVRTVVLQKIIKHGS